MIYFVIDIFSIEKNMNKLIFDFLSKNNNIILIFPLPLLQQRLKSNIYIIQHFAQCIYERAHLLATHNLENR